MSYAAALLWLLGVFGSPGDSVPEIPDSIVWDNRVEIRRACEELQIIEKELPQGDEGYYGGGLLTNENSVQYDLAQLYERFNELKDTPLVEQFNCKFNIDERTIQQMINASYEYRTLLINRREFEADRLDIINNAIKESDWLRDVWIQIRVLNDKQMSNWDRRTAYKRLKDLLGDEFEAEELPDFLPHHRLQKIKFPGR